MGVNRKENEKRFAAINEQNVESDKQQSGALEHIRQRIEDAQQQINTGNAILNQITNSLRLDWLRQLGSELKDLLRRAIAMNVATYHAVISIQAALPSRLECVLIEEPFILEDPIGRIAPVHLQFVTSWEAFHAVMEHRFSELQGFKKVQQRKYGLQDRATGRDIDQTRPWQRAFLPGQRVEMAFIFQNDRAADADDTNTTCPGCQTPSEDIGDTDVHCQNCSIWYRRITVVQEVEPTPQMPLPQPWKTLPRFGQSDLRIDHRVDLSGPVLPGRRRVAPDDLEGEEDVREFKRVRVMRTKKRVRQRQFGVNGATPYTTFFTLSKISSDVATGSLSVGATQWRPGEATSQHSKIEQPQPQADLQLPELPPCFRMPGHTSSWRLNARSSRSASPSPPVPYVLPHPSPRSDSDPLLIPNLFSYSSNIPTEIVYSNPQELRDNIKVLEDVLTKAGSSYPYGAYYKSIINAQYKELEQLERDQATISSVEGEPSQHDVPDRESGESATPVAPKLEDAQFPT